MATDEDTALRSRTIQTIRRADPSYASISFWLIAAWINACLEEGYILEDMATMPASGIKEQFDFWLSTRNK